MANIAALFNPGVFWAYKKDPEKMLMDLGLNIKAMKYEKKSL